MAIPDTSREGLTNTTSNEHLSDAQSKRVTIRGLDPTSGLYKNVGLKDNGDGTYSLITAVTSTPSVAASNATTKVTVGATSTAVLSANSSRTSAYLVNDSVEDIYINLSATAVINEGIRLNSEGGSAYINDYTGAITAICASGSKNLTVTEL